MNTRKEQRVPPKFRKPPYSKVAIRQNSDGLTKVYINGIELTRCYAISYEQDTKTVPMFVFSVYGEPNLSFDEADVTILVNPDSIPNVIEAIDYTLGIEGISPGESWESIREKLYVAVNAGSAESD